MAASRLVSIACHRPKGACRLIHASWQDYWAWDLCDLTLKVGANDDCLDIEDMAADQHCLLGIGRGHVSWAMGCSEQVHADFHA